MTTKTWLTATALFFAWGFVMHSAGLLLHEFGGHALAAVLFGCGIDGYLLTFFGHGQVHLTRCDRWTFDTILVCDWAGIVLTSAAGLAAAYFMRRRSLPPYIRLMLALVGYFFLLGQLGYATQGGFHDLYDPRRSSLGLGEHGLHWLAWIPPLIGYAAASFFCGRAAIDAFREQFGAHSRLQTLMQLASTLGVAGILYFAAFRIEWQIRTDMAMRGVEAEAERVAVVQHGPPPFPIHLVMLGIAFGALVYALARPVKDPASPKPIPRRATEIILALTGVLFGLSLLLIL
jgi:hypothetical protein